MKLASVTPCYREESFIGACLDGLPGVDKFVVISEKPFFGEALPMDKTEEIAIEKGAEVIKGTWPEDSHMRNLVINLCQDYDWILTFDADEHMTAEDFEKFKKFLSETDKPAVAVTTMNTYFKSFDYRVDPREKFNPIIAVKPSTRFTYIRGINSDFSMTPEDIIFHHFSYAKSDEAMYKKVTTFSHANDFDGIKWYNEVWKKWTPESKNFHPTHPNQYEGVIYDPAPKEIRQRFFDISVDRIPHGLS